MFDALVFPCALTFFGVELAVLEASFVLPHPVVVPVQSLAVPISIQPLAIVVVSIFVSHLASSVTLASLPESIVHIAVSVPVNALFFGVLAHVVRSSARESAAVIVSCDRAVLREVHALFIAFICDNLIDLFYLLWLQSDLVHFLVLVRSKSLLNFIASFEELSFFPGLFAAVETMKDSQGVFSYLELRVFSNVGALNDHK